MCCLVQKKQDGLTQQQQVQLRTVVSRSRTKTTHTRNFFLSECVADTTEFSTSVLVRSTDILAQSVVRCWLRCDAGGEAREGSAARRGAHRQRRVRSIRFDSISIVLMFGTFFLRCNCTATRRAVERIRTRRADISDDFCSCVRRSFRCFISIVMSTMRSMSACSRAIGTLCCHFSFSLCFSYFSIDIQQCENRR